MYEQNHIGIALVGPAGDLARYRDAFAGQENVSVVAVVDPDAARRRVFADSWDVPAFASQAELSRSAVSYHVVVVAARGAARVAETERALRDGKHVLSAAPVTLDLDKLDTLLDIANDGGRVLAQAFPFQPSVLDDIGSYLFDRDEAIHEIRVRWPIRDEPAGGRSLLEAHLLEVAQLVAELVSEYDAGRRDVVPPELLEVTATESDDAASCLVELDGGIRVSVVLARADTGRLEVTGDRSIVKLELPSGLEGMTRPWASIKDRADAVDLPVPRLEQFSHHEQSDRLNAEDALVRVRPYRRDVEQADQAWDRWRIAFVDRALASAADPRDLNPETPAG